MLDLVQIADVIGCSDIEPIVRLIKHGILPVFQIAIPILLIIYGSIDLGKAVMANDDKEIKGATTKLIKRAIAAVVVFFIPFIVNLVMRLVSTSGVKDDEITTVDDTSWSDCWTSID